MAVSDGVSQTTEATREPPPSQKRASQPEPQPDRVVARPTPRAQADDPRAFQVGQIQRRFKPEVTESSEASAYAFGLKPSDPDFPYEIETLQCVLTVPKTYPLSGTPNIRVKNNDIPRGFQINIERGFDTLASSSPNATLLALVNRLDRELETILAGRMADTIKIVVNKGPVAASKDVPSTATPVLERSVPQASQPPVPLPPSEDQIRAAESKRQQHTRQLEARFGRLRSFSKSSDGQTYTLPLDSPKKMTWPALLRGLNTVTLHVPQRYPIQAASIHLGVDCEESRRVENAFEGLADALHEPTLTQLANHLTQHLSEMAINKETAVPLPQSEKVVPGIPQQPKPIVSPQPANTASSDDKPHIHYIPRPPEWAQQQDDGDESASESSSAGDSSSDEAEPEFPQAEAEVTTGPSAPQERGILLSFPQVEIHGIELLELTSLNITVKCERCKDTMDVHRLRNSTANGLEMQQKACKKCATGLAIGFRADLIHVNSARAGYLDLDGCTVIDMLPSNFVPTCSECSTAYPAPGVSAVRGDSAFAICRECHHKMTFRIPEIKFLQASPSAIRASKAPGRKKPKENLRITAGSELPRRGRCKHYSKSHRWFRFSCCSKVFPCDRCHDEASDHPTEHANRMLCGYCSREQNFRPEDCGICHAVLVGKKGGRFWEGGQGTRDVTRMSKKDPRKYRRRPGTKPKT
ncbi:hypothetical protein LTR29_012862 [Friedmanniomyces endolithicus]|nr:hypothetical protein LTR29_012862 [Friedmanniomyces endolithicus]